MSALFDVKNSRFFTIYSVSTWTRGVEPVQTLLWIREEGVNFSWFCMDGFYGLTDWQTSEILSVK